MKKIVLSIMIAGMLLSSPAFSANPASKTADKFKKCSATTPNGCKSRARKKAIAKAKCSEMTDNTQKEECLKAIEEKAAARKAAESKE